MRPMLVAISCFLLWGCTGAGEAPVAGEERLYPGHRDAKPDISLFAGWKTVF